MIFTCNVNHKDNYDLEYSDIGFYQEESTPMNLVITANEVSDGVNSNNVKSGIVTANHDIGELSWMHIRMMSTCPTNRLKEKEKTSH